MKLFILFVIEYQGSKTEINSGLRWFNADAPLITEMDDTHLMNARCWLFRQRESLDALSYPEPIKRGYNYSQWLIILKKEEERRAENKRKVELARIEKLKLATLSVATRKKRAAKLLEGNPTAADVAKAEELLGIKLTVNDLNSRETKETRGGKYANHSNGHECYGSDHADIAFESELAANGY